MESWGGGGMGRGRWGVRDGFALAFCIFLNRAGGGGWVCFGFYLFFTLLVLRGRE